MPELAAAAGSRRRSAGQDRDRPGRRIAQGPSSLRRGAPPARRRGARRGAGRAAGHRQLRQRRARRRRDRPSARPSAPGVRSHVGRPRRSSSGSTTSAPTSGSASVARVRPATRATCASARRSPPALVRSACRGPTRRRPSTAAAPSAGSWPSRPPTSTRSTSRSAVARWPRRRRSGWATSRCIPVQAEGCAPLRRAWDRSPPTSTSTAAAERPRRLHVAVGDRTGERGVGHPRRRHLRLAAALLARTHAHRG